VSAAHHTPAFRLLAACANWPPSSARTTAVARAAAHPALAWAQLPALAERHRMAGLVMHALASAEVRPPDPVHRQLAAMAQRDAVGNLALLGDAVVLLRTLSAAGIAARVLKGPALVLHLYGTPTLRQCNDLDLLVDDPQLERAAALCASLGYARLHPHPALPDVLLPLWRRWHKDLVFRHANGRLVELHARPANCPDTAQRLALPSGFGEVPLGGGAALPTVLGEALYAYLCWHGAQSAWSRLKWLADVAALTAGRTDAELVALHDAARARGAGRASGVALLLLATLMERPLPPALRDRLGRAPVLRALVRLSLRVMGDPREVTAVPWRSVSLFLARLAMAPGWGARWHEAVHVSVEWSLVERSPTVQRLLRWGVQRWPETQGGALLALGTPLFLLAKLARKLSATRAPRAPAAST
jgi:hypothetical protein